MVAMLLLCAAYGRAENALTHRFWDNASIRYFTNYTVGILDTIAYTCSGTNASFGFDCYNPSKISINLPTTNSAVTTSAVSNLTQLQISYNNESKKRPSFSVQLSRDSVHWSNVLDHNTTSTVTIGANSGQYVVDVVPGMYYVRITNTSSNKASIYQIKYCFGEDCNCLLYMPQ